MRRGWKNTYHTYVDTKLRDYIHMINQGGVEKRMEKPYYTT
jgi:hypothetical protein